MPQRQAIKAACSLLLVLFVVCNAAPSESEIEASDSALLRERRTYYNYRSCGKPGAPGNGWTIFGGTTTGNKALHSCKAGYLLVGAKLRICQSNGRWTPAIPECRLVDCGDPGQPENGMKWLSSTTLGSYVKYKCLEGYKLKGYSYRKCLSTGKWSGRLPTCEAVGCQSLENPRNGKVVVRGLTATYSCNQGYVLVGAATRQCVRGKWQPEAPICRVIDCGPLQPPENGVVQLDRTVFGSIAQYQCNRGFRLQGSDVRTCQANSQWSERPPTCIAIECPRLRDIPGGSVIVRSRTVGSTATYRCNTGFTLVGNRQRTCGPGGEWSGEEPICEGIECPELSAPANGQVDVSGLRPGSRARYSCNPGFLLRGSERRTCQNSGEWSNQEPFCIAILCSDLDDPENGAVTVSGNTPSSTATYACNRGYTLDGPQTRTCQSNGQWSQRPPVCIAIQCQNLSPPANGQVDVSGLRVGSRATYRCNTGFTLVGNRQRTCGTGGEWSGEEPICEGIECPELSAPANGQVDVSGLRPGSRAHYSCNPGFRLRGSERRTCQNNGEWSNQEPFCIAILCSDLDDPENGAVTVSGNTPSSTATYVCNRGYTLDGPQTRTCQSNGQWSRRPPVCIAIQCQNLSPPANGQVDVSGLRAGSRATYRCNTGFTLVGNRQRTCGTDGEWSGEEPICEGIECPELSAPANGQVDVSGLRPGSRARYSCNPGFLLRGSERRTCQNSGGWSNQEPTCISIQCSQLSDPANGSVTVSTLTPGSVASYSCLPGFVLEGVTLRACQFTGEWSFEAPVCVEIRCPQLQDPVNGEVILNGDTPSSTAIYICNSGYELKGVKIRTCQINGEWSGTVPICIESFCPALTAPQNGRVSVQAQTVDSIATYSCNEGFALEGEAVRTCIDIGEGLVVWTGQEPTCVPIRCPRLSAPANGRVVAPVRTVGSQASYSCNDGYRISGASTRVCQSNSQWSQQEPTCVLVDCGRLPDIPRGRVEVTTTTFLSTATYVCDSGYSIVGTSVRTCLATGVWSGREPTCTPSTCGSLNNPSNGQVTIAGAGISATATYSCNTGYLLRGVVSRVCQTNGQWSGFAPTCEVVTCSDLPAPTNGDVRVTGFEFNSIATYTCDSGYVLVGEDTRTCQADGSWSGIRPLCQVVQCEVLDFPENGQVIQIGNTVGATATYSCFPGYLLEGDELRICQKSSEWTGTPPICRPVDCGRLPDIAFGSVTITTTTVGSQATYSCRQGYVLMGATIRTCQVDGFWSGEEPSCQIFTCSSLDDPESGQVFTTGFEVGDTATYICVDGYSLQGEEMRECLSNGEWSGRAPFCIGNVCPQLVAPDNGQVFFRGVTVGSTARYSCLPGFVLRGAPDRTCLSEGTWSGREPVCEAVNCPDLPDPANGEVTLSGIIFGSTATYRCEVGFGLVGVSVRSCQADSTWSREAPTCQISMCSNLEPPQNGNIVTTSTQFGGQATYSCIEGYQLEGVEVRTCQANGFWTDTAPFCSIVNCGFLDPPKDGRVSFTSIAYRAVAVYVCFPGYRLEGVEERTCQANGEWSDQEPSCRRIDCGLLEAPKNGDISFSQGTVFRSVATYNCDSPFQLVGSATRVCRADMVWSGEAPICESIECEDLESPANGLVVVPSRLPGSTATYSCDTGYNLIGSQTRSCLNNGFWSGVVPICQAGECNPLKPPRNGDVKFTSTLIGSIANYECFEGFSLEGEEIRTCIDGGTQGGIWTGNDPTCNPIDCGALDDIFNGFVEFESTLFGSIASYTCRDGFVLMGKGIRQCIENGQWSGEEPVCQDVNCGQLGSPANGQILISGTSFGFTATYSCNEGFTIARGSQSRICQITGEWSGEELVCVANQCPDLTNPANGQVTVNGRDYLDTAEYSCNHGYVLSGVSVRTCGLNGIWGGVAPTCIRPQPSEVECGLPPFLQNGQFTLSTGTIGGSRATYTCFRGYRLVGSTTRTCLITEEWSRESISCEIIDCGVLPSIPNGGIILASTEIDSQATYFCDSGFILQGVEIRICQDNGLWSVETPSCVPREVFTCVELLAPANGEVSVSGLTVGSVASYRCNNGYILVGAASRRCLDTQGWTGSAPTCHPIDCGLLEPPANGQVVTMGTTLGSRAMYTCNRGYVLLGSVTRVCGADRSWSGSEPTCSAVECGHLPDPRYGFVVLTDVTLGSVATYRCQTGFSLVGSTTRECARSGRWTGVAPTCESTTPSGCGDPGTPELGTLIGDDFRVGATVYYECDSGYELVGPGSRQCEPSGTWTGRVPQCVLITETCREGATVYDSCQRRCTCRGGVLVNCCRVRRDFASLSVTDRERYIQTVLTVATDDRYQAKYEALINQYSASLTTLAQSTDPTVSQFFPWHRYFLLKYEDLLQEVDCRVTIPYWDWSAVPLTPYMTPVWNPDSGFGDLARAKDGCVENGPFRFDRFEIVGGGCLQREYRMQMFPNRAIVERDLLTLPAEDFTHFHQVLQVFIHVNVRCFVGGQMCSDEPANDPVYILHLAQIDSIFARWQAIDSSRGSIYLNDNRELELSDGNLVSDYRDISNLPGGNSVCYEPAEIKTHVPQSMQFMLQTLEDMTNNSDLRMTCVTDEQMGNVHMSQNTVDFMHSECGN